MTGDRTRHAQNAAIARQAKAAANVAEALGRRKPRPQLSPQEKLDDEIAQAGRDSTKGGGQ